MTLTKKKLDFYSTLRYYPSPSLPDRCRWLKNNFIFIKNLAFYAERNFLKSWKIHGIISAEKIRKTLSRHSQPQLAAAGSVVQTTLHGGAEQVFSLKFITITFEKLRWNSVKYKVYYSHLFENIFKCFLRVREALNQCFSKRFLQQTNNLINMTYFSVICRRLDGRFGPRCHQVRIKNKNKN